jgi:hypothetical protein
VALALGLRVLAGRSFRRFAAFALAAAVPLGLLLYYDAVCFGSPWILSSAKEADPAYAALARHGAFGFVRPSPRIALAFLLDPARGVLLFSPFLLWSPVGLVRWWRSGRLRADWWFVVAGGDSLRLALRLPNWHGAGASAAGTCCPAFLRGAADRVGPRTPLARALPSRPRSSRSRATRC